MFEQSIRILIVDDMMTMRKLLAKNCRDLGYKDLIEAADGKLAWEALQAASPPIGLIISDWNMPNVTGLDLLKRVRGDQRFQKLPFILVTAESEQKQVVEALTAGVSNYLVKPFSKNSLYEKLVLTYEKLKPSP